MAGNYDPNKDYAAAIKKETNPGKKQQLISERQNKIDAMNAAGTNKNNYNNSIYGGGSSGSSSSGSNKNSGSSGGSKNNSSGYYDPNKDYAAAIKNATSDAERNQLIAERQNKIDAMNAAGTNKGYTNDIYNGNSGGTTVNKADYGYFDSGKDYAAAIAAETDPVKKQQLIQERQNKLDYMNATGQNKNGYSNSIYGNGNATSFGQAAEPSVYGQYQNQDAVLQDAALGKLQLTQAENAALANMNLTAEDLALNNPLAQTNYEQALNLAQTPEQRAALTAYFTRLQSNIDPSEVAGVYAGDTSMSLPDQALMLQYQTAYDQAKAAGNTTGMAAAEKMMQNLKDNYLYYPLKNSNGYGLGENDLGWIRDIVVRVDSLGNKYVDEYGLNNVTTTRYNADGSQSWKNQRKISAHDDYVERQWDRAAEEYGRPEDWTAIRIADANDVNLSAADLMAKYGAQAGMGRDLYGNARINSKVANGKTLADVYAEQGITGYGGNGAGNAALNANAGVTDIFSTYGYFDPNFDYAAALQTETDPTRRAQLMQERQNKINYLNGTGQNAGGFTNAIYGQTVQQTTPMQQMPMLQETMLPEYVGMSQEDIMNTYGDIAAQLEAQRNAYLQQTQAQIDAAQNLAGTEFDDMARQAYILKRQQEMALPQQLAAMGISGGGSETANLQLQTNYQNNLNANEQQRAQMAREYALQKLQAQMQANSDIAGYYADAQQNAMNAWQNEQANKNAWNQWAANYQQNQLQFQNQLAQQQYENQLMAQQYQDEQKMQQIDLALKLGDYSKLAALGYDTNYLQRMQDAELAQIAMAANKSRSSSGGDGYYDPGVEDETEIVLGGGNDEVSVSGMMKLQQLAAMGGTENPMVANAIQKMLNSGEINDATYQAFLNSMK